MDVVLQDVRQQQTAIARRERFVAMLSVPVRAVVKIVKPVPRTVPAKLPVNQAGDIAAGMVSVRQQEKLQVPAPLIVHKPPFFYYTLSGIRGRESYPIVFTSWR
jgi:hypothetical protein